MSLTTSERKEKRKLLAESLDDLLNSIEQEGKKGFIAPTTTALIGIGAETAILELLYHQNERIIELLEKISEQGGLSS